MSRSYDEQVGKPLSQDLGRRSGEIDAIDKARMIMSIEETNSGKKEEKEKKRNRATWPGREMVS